MNPEIAITIKGMIVGIYSNSKKALTYSVDGITYVPIFSTKQKYEESIHITKPAMQFLIPNVIGNELEFYSTIKGYRIMLDPVIPAFGRVTWIEVIKP